MSLVYVNSCGDHYATANIAQRWSTVTGVPLVVVGAGRRAGNAIQFPSTAQKLEQTVPALATYVVGIAFKLNLLLVCDLLIFKEGATDHVIIRITPTGAIEVLRGDLTQLGITSAGLVFPGFYNYLEVLCTVDGAVGVVTVNMNNTNLLSLTALDTDNAGAVPEINAIEINGSTGVLTFDDVYILDTTGAAPQNGILGDTRIESLVPVADGAVQNFPIIEPVSPITHFDKVDDLTPDDAVTFVSSEDAADIDTYDMETLSDPGGSSAIFGVQQLVYARKDKVTAKSLRPIARVGVTNYQGAINPLDTLFDYYVEMWQQDPDTAADWTETGVNTAEWGAEVA